MMKAKVVSSAHLAWISHGVADSRQRFLWNVGGDQPWLVADSRQKSLCVFFRWNFSSYFFFRYFFHREKSWRESATVVVTPLLSRGVVFARDSPHLLSVFGKKPDITGKGLILRVRKSLVWPNWPRNKGVRAKTRFRRTNKNSRGTQGVTTTVADSRQLFW